MFPIAGTGDSSGQWLQLKIYGPQEKGAFSGPKRVIGLKILGPGDERTERPERE
jgi:hypothetical protein